MFWIKTIKLNYQNELVGYEFDAIWKKFLSDKEKGIIERTVINKRILPGTNDIYSSLIVDITLKKKFET